MLKDKIRKRESGIILYGITPPKQKHPDEKKKEISLKQVQRIKTLGIDGLILYDIQDETERTSDERPFPFLPTIDSTTYARDYLSTLELPKIIYKFIGKYTDTELSHWLISTKSEDNYSVFVGAPSKNQKVRSTLGQAYDLRKQINPDLILGGVTIPERHAVKKDEHIRVHHKMDQGCEFFVSQAVYHLEGAKQFLSDYYILSRENQREPVPIIFTMTPCGSLKTLQFMKWLGIHIPLWLENDLKHSGDILKQSIKLSKEIFQELFEYGMEKNIPIGCNIESVAIRKEEIEASIQLLRDIQKITGKT